MRLRAQMQHTLLCPLTLNRGGLLLQTRGRLLNRRLKHSQRRYLRVRPGTILGWKSYRRRQSPRVLGTQPGSSTAKLPLLLARSLLRHHLSASVEATPCPSNLNPEIRIPYRRHSSMPITRLASRPRSSRSHGRARSPSTARARSRTPIRYTLCRPL